MKVKARMFQAGVQLAVWGRNEGWLLRRVMKEGNVAGGVRAGTGGSSPHDSSARVLLGLIGSQRRVLE